MDRHQPSLKVCALQAAPGYPSKPECELECHAGGTCLYMWVWGNTSRRGEISFFVASTPLFKAVLLSLSSVSSCVLTAPLLSPPPPLQEQPSSYSAWLLSPEAAKFNLSVQLIQLISKTQQIREASIAISITTHVEWSSFSEEDTPLLFPCSYFINMEETVEAIIKLESHTMGSILERCWQGLQSFANFSQSFHSFQCGFFTGLNLED